MDSHDESNSHHMMTGIPQRSVFTPLPTRSTYITATLMLYDPACPFFQSTDLMKQPINSPS